MKKKEREKERKKDTKKERQKEREREEIWKESERAREREREEKRECVCLFKKQPFYSNSKFKSHRIQMGVIWEKWKCYQVKISQFNIKCQKLEFPSGEGSASDLVLLFVYLSLSCICVCVCVCVCVCTTSLTFVGGSERLMFVCSIIFSVIMGRRNTLRKIDRQ